MFERLPLWLRKTLAWSVHLFTGTGAVWGFLTLLAIWELNFRLAIVYIILVPTVGAYYLNAWALGRVSPSTVAVYIYLQPLIAFSVAPLLLGERLSWRTIVAAVLIFAGVLVVTRRGRSQAIQKVTQHPEAFGH